MWKSMLAGTVALWLTGSGITLAQQRPAQPTSPTAQVSPAPPAGAPAQNPSAQQPGEAQALAEGHIAELRFRLALTPDQEKNWPAFEQAYRDFAKLRSERWRDRAERGSDKPMENFQAWADFASRRINGLKRLADAAVPLYQSLDQNQQRQFIDRIYAWHPRLARLSEHIGARSGEGHDEGWRGRGAPWSQGCSGYGMGPHSDWRERGGEWDEDHDGGYEHRRHHRMGRGGRDRGGEGSDWDEDD